MSAGVGSGLTRLVVATVMLAVAALATLAFPAAARGPDPYVARDITVERTAENAVAAKRAAMDALVSEALGDVFRRLTRPRDRKRLPPPDAWLANRLLTGMKIISESSNRVRYSVTATVTFDRYELDRIFTAAGVPVYSRPGPAALLIPAHVRDGEAAMYADAGEWSEALHTVARKRWLISLKVAKGSLEDRLETLERLRNRDRVSLDFLRLRYNMRGAVLAEFNDGDDGQPAHLRLAGDTGAGDIDMIVPIQPDIDDPIDFAAVRAAELLDDHWKQVQGHGAGAGVRINGAPIHPFDVDPLQDGAAGIAETNAILTELRLTPKAATAQAEPVIAQAEPVIEPRDRPERAEADQVRILTGSVSAAPRVNRNETMLSIPIADDIDTVDLSATMARLAPVTAFMITHSPTGANLMLWHRGGGQDLNAALAGAGYAIGHDLVANTDILVQAAR